MHRNAAEAPIRPTRPEVANAALRERDPSRPQIVPYGDRTYRPGVLGRLVTLQARYYVPRFGFGATYETETAAAMAAFLRDFEPDRDGLWLVERGAETLGSLVLDGRDPDAAEIRWVFVADEVRGHGLAGRMLASALEHARRSGRRRVRLVTNPRLEAAVALYLRVGFTLVEAVEERRWGRRVAVHTYELDLDDVPAPHRP